MHIVRKNHFEIKRFCTGTQHEGREVLTAAGKNAGFVRARIFVANDRQYAVMVAAKTEPATDNDDARRFLDSFRIGAVKKGK